MQAQTIMLPIVYRYLLLLLVLLLGFTFTTTVASACLSPVFRGRCFRNALNVARLSVRTGAVSALRSRQLNTGTGIAIPGGHAAAAGRRRRRSHPHFPTGDCPARASGATSLGVGFGLGLPIIDDILEPIEMLWEFYMARDEIQEQMLANAGKILRKNSVRALGFTGAAVATAETLARLGLIGDRGEGVAEYLRENQRVRERLQKMDDAFDEQMPGVVARTCRSCFRRYRGLPEKLKFTIAFSTGATIQQTLINAAVSAIKLSVGTFVVLETMAFTGIIGEPGESIVEWVDDHDQEIRERFGKRWGNKAKRFRQGCRKYLSFDGIVELYEAAVDEEKVATFGLGLGMVAGSLV
mmetsp:Transcript_6856/g.14387  ORF Transcript_6856/g.14387 Transcript_6856/m.14387 type:complete len:353 (-) Transcript_6856:43-1101(-)